jgi:hypothetical protein
MSRKQVRWRGKPAREDYRAALNYLSLICSARDATKIVRALQKTAVIKRAAKDLLRASALPVLPRDEPHVAEDLKRIHKGKPLSPILLVQGDRGKHIPLLVADGYHRICAIYHFDESSPIPCRIAAP